MIINHNLMAMNAQRRLDINDKESNMSIRKLVSGLKINRAADDPAGLSISEKMRAQIRGLAMASKNSQDAISMIQTAEGAMQEVNDILARMYELSVQSANDTNTDQDRLMLDMEFQALKSAIDDIAYRTDFNTQKILTNYIEGHETPPNNYVSLIASSIISPAYPTYDHPVPANSLGSPSIPGNTLTPAQIDINTSSRIVNVDDDGVLYISDILNQLPLGADLTDYTIRFSSNAQDVKIVGDGSTIDNLQIICSASNTSLSIDGLSVNNTNDKIPINFRGGGTSVLNVAGTSSITTRNTAINSSGNLIMSNSTQTLTITSTSVGGTVINSSGIISMEGVSIDIDVPNVSTVAIKASNVRILDNARVTTTVNTDVNNNAIISVGTGTITIGSGRANENSHVFALLQGNVDMINADVTSMTNANQVAIGGNGRVVRIDAYSHVEAVNNGNNATIAGKTVDLLGSDIYVTNNGSGVAISGTTHVKIREGVTVANKGGGDCIISLNGNVFLESGEIKATLEGPGNTIGTGSVVYARNVDIFNATITSATAISLNTTKALVKVLKNLNIVGGNLDIDNATGAAIEGDVVNIFNAITAKSGSGTAIYGRVLTIDAINCRIDATSNTGSAIGGHIINFNNGEIIASVVGPDSIGAAIESTKEVNIFAGIINASVTGFNSSGAAIGGAKNGDGAEVYISKNVDSVTAYVSSGNGRGAAIGGGANGNGGILTLEEGVPQKLHGVIEGGIGAGLTDSDYSMGRYDSGSVYSNGYASAPGDHGIVRFEHPEDIHLLFDPSRDIFSIKGTVPADRETPPVIRHVIGNTPLFRTDISEPHTTVADVPLSYTIFGDPGYSYQTTNLSYDDRKGVLLLFLPETFDTFLDYQGERYGGIVIKPGHHSTSTYPHNCYPDAPCELPLININLLIDGYKIHTGANKDEIMNMLIPSVRTAVICITREDIKKQVTAEASINKIGVATSYVAGGRAKIGAYHNRLEHTIQNIENTAENLQAAESRIRDVDMAKEMSVFIKNNIISQAAMAMLSQAHQTPQTVLSLLR